jgi:uncharacterized protein YjbI with pentapeptide repeats
MVPYRRFALTGLLCVLALALGTSAVLGAGKAAKKPKEQRISLLYALNAGSGTLIPKKGHGAQYQLVLKGLDRNVTWFSDRPTRRSGSFPVAGLAESWKGFGFTADPPNAALTYTEPSGVSGRTVIIELSHPRYSKGKLSFAARVLDPGTIEEPNLAGHARTADRHPARRLADASLFIDDTTAKTAAGCVLQPHADCEEMDLGSLNLYAEDIFDSDFKGSNLDGSRIVRSDLHLSFFLNASLRNADLESDDLSRSDFEGTDLTGASLRNSELEGAIFGSTNLAGADLTGAALHETYVLSSSFPRANMEDVRGGGRWTNDIFYGANLRNANLEAAMMSEDDFEEADLTGARLPPVRLSNFCNAKMPDGTIGPCDGPEEYLP